MYESGLMGGRLVEQWSRLCVASPHTPVVIIIIIFHFVQCIPSLSLLFLFCDIQVTEKCSTAMC